MIYTWFWCREKSCEGKLFRNRRGVKALCPHCSKANTEELPPGVDVSKLLPPCSAALSGDPEMRKTI
jgi:hypothetical protein